MWAFELTQSLANEFLLLIFLPVVALAVLLVLALVELALLLVLRAINVTGWQVLVMDTAKPVEIEVGTGSVLRTHPRYSTTVLTVATMAGSNRLRKALPTTHAGAAP